MGIAYRQEINGLRAIAVLAVVLYHAGIGGAGYVGVDVFFVISGYLITGLLLREQADTGTLDILAFYARRVRRIIPAAAVVVLAVLAAGALLLAPSQQVAVYESAASASVFGANVFFQFGTGYFDGRSSEMPLLHLWSLSVEEQFYFLWPALILLVPGRWLRPMLAALAVASLALAEVWIARGSNAAFFQMPSRFWELAAGGLIAASSFRAPRWLAHAGIVLTLAACAIPFAHFPGLGALPAALGACAIIAAVHGGATNALLASRPMVGVGLVSYSLYLWHWPLLAFYRATSIGEGATSTKLALCACALVLAVASYRYIEQPFRRMRFPSGRTVLYGAGLSSMLALSACALGFRAGDGALPDNPQANAAEHDMPSKACHLPTDAKVALKCQPHTRTLVYGDSMAWAWLPAVPGGSDVTMDGCPPFVGYQPRQTGCREHNAAVATLPADVVVIAARWKAYGDLSPFAATLEALAHVPRIVVIGPTPEIRDMAPRCIRRHAEAVCAIPRAEFDAKARPILAELRAMAAEHPNVIVVDVTDRFCTATECPPVLNGTVLYWDDHHVSSTAARSAAGVFL